MNNLFNEVVAGRMPVSLKVMIKLHGTYEHCLFDEKGGNENGQQMKSRRNRSILTWGPKDFFV